jgi:hypothetical protein
MENPVVIKMVSSGEKGYVGDYKGPSYPYSVYYTKKPFSDPNVQKFNLEDALKIVKTQQIDSIFKLIQIIDAGGKIHYDNYNNRVEYKDKNKLRNLKKGVGDVINEEIQKFLIKESYIMAGDNFNFKQQVKNVFFYNYSSFSTDYDVDVVNSNIVLTWQVSFWLNDMGIENFIIDAQKVEGVYVMDLYDKQTDELKQQTQKNIAETEWKFVIQDDVAITLGKSLYVKDLDFDFKNQTCTVNFQ